MKRYPLFALVVFFFIFSNEISSQDIPVQPKMVKTGNFLGISRPLRDIPAMSKEDYSLMVEKAKKRGKNTPWDKPTYPFASTALPKGDDPVWQKSNGTKSGSSLAPLLNFEGQTSPYYPPDCNGTAGPNHYMQTVNTTYAIYNKSGTLLAGPTNMNLLFGSVPGATCNDGDPIILYDEQANRFVAVEFSLCGSNDLMLVAVSSTNDPTGTWYQYSFDVVDMPDYEKMAVWRDGYYMGTNTQPTTGSDIYVFERAQMLIGGTARMVAFDNPNRPGTGVVVVPPVDNDGPAAPAGAPGTFIAFNDDGVGGGADELWLYELAVNWTTPANSTFSRTQQLAVQPFDSQFNNWEDITQPGTTRKLCAISTVIMNVPQYRNFGTYQSIVCCHTVDVDGTDHAGVRWYELRKTPPATTWTIRQQGTYAPDAHSRWMGSVAMNGSNKIAVGYSISSSTVYPGIRYAGQSAAAYSSASGVLDVPEENALTGANYQTTYNRWGDYSSMSVDPSDDQTFWFTTEYIGASEARKTKIISFKIGNNPIVATLAATAITGTSATINGTVNPNGLATNYHFEWGTLPTYGNSTTTTSVGSGSSAVSVNANLTSLTSGTTYHFRLVAVNSDGTSNGSDFTFIPGGAVVSTTAISSITLTSAISGGTVTADGGSSVTARGVCWSTSATPDISGSHTTEGFGLGVFTSSILGLSANTSYHVRAYATNANGTYYGEDVQFSTLCGVYTLPFSETFSGTTLPTCWSQIDHQGNGQIWVFGTITSGSPNPALTGNYAYLNSDAYGSSSSQNADLITPTLNLSSYSPVTLQFSHYFKSYSGSSGTLAYSIDNGTTWTTISTFTTTSSTNPVAFSQAIPGVALQSNVKFKWNYTGTYGYYWGIDNVQITGTIIGPSLSVTPANQPVSALSGSTAFSVTSTAAWTAVSNQTWCTVTPSGAGTGTLTANFTQNTTSSSRVANITVSATGLTPVVVTVTQAAPTISVTPADQPVTYPAGTTSFSVTSNSTWTVSSNQIWCSVTLSGSGTGTITATYSANPTVIARVANVTVTVPGLTPIVVTVTQAAGLPTLSVTPADQPVTAASGMTSFTITSNASWTVTSNQTWCTVPSSGTGSLAINATYTQNPTASSRVANVTVTVTGLAPVVVTVTQAAPTLSVTPADQAVAYTAGNTSFSVTSNSNWTVSSNQSWCTVPSGGTGNDVISTAYALNTSPSVRIANITVTVSGLAPVVVTVTQAGSTAPEFNFTIVNDVQTSDKTMEFDLYLVNKQPSVPLELSIIQAGILVNSGIIGGGTITTSILPGYSDLVAIQQPTFANWATGTLNGCIKITPKAGPGCGNGTIISTTGLGTRICRVRIANSVPFTASSQANLAFSFPTSPYPTKVFHYSGIPCVSSQMITNSTNCFSLGTNPILNGPPSLSVSPSDQPVNSPAGSIPFVVTSNASWTAISNQSWCTVTPSGFANGTITAGYTENIDPSPRIANVTVTVVGLTPVVVTVTQAGAPLRTFNLTVFLEGLYSGYSTMRPAMDDLGYHWGETIADKLTIELHAGSNYSNIIYTATNVSLNTNGTASFTLPSSYNGNYYVTIRQRNHILTATAFPVSFNTSTVNFNFDLPGKAFGSNLGMMIDGKYVFYAGDVNQDGLVDGTDLSDIDNRSTVAASGYLPEDVNGDGLIDGSDLSITGNNADVAIGAITP